jgi:hypothetical protein
MELRKNLSILDLSPKEEKVLLAIIKGFITPLSIAKETKVTRPAVYDIMEKLKKRGLVKSKITNGKKTWHLIDQRELASSLYETKKILLSLSDGREEVEGVDDSLIVLHRGKEAVVDILHDMFSSHKHERFLTLTGTSPITDWMTMMGSDEIGEVNRIIKKNGLITELVAPERWIEEHFKALGKEWAVDYEGRTATSVHVDKKYFDHGAQLFAFKDALYLLALGDQLIIEIRHSAIQKMILSMYAFMKDHGEKVDANRILRELMGKEV